MNTQHEIFPGDPAVLAQMAEMLAGAPPLQMIPGCREAFDGLLSMTPIADGVLVEEGTVGGVPGIWCSSTSSSPSAAMLYLHGGGYVLGSAKAYTGFVSQLVARSGLRAFVADYRRAPEARFPAAFDDAVAVLGALHEDGVKDLYLAGDSAGGGLAIAVMAALSKLESGPDIALRRGIAFSPWVDPTLSSESVEQRAHLDPLLSHTQLEEAASQYCAPADKDDPRCNALRADLSKLPPIQVHVGENEVLFDDAVRVCEAAREAGREAELHVWNGMIHVFQSNAGSLSAADASLDEAARFCAGS